MSNIKTLDARLLDLQSAAERIEQAICDISGEIEEMRDYLPIVPTVRGTEVDGVKWFTDGRRFIRGAWPGEHEAEELTSDPSLLFAAWDKVVTPVTVTEEFRYDHYRLARLSNGATLQADWLKELTHGRGYSPFHDGGDDPIVFRDAAGKLAAVQMPYKMAGAQ